MIHFLFYSLALSLLHSVYLSVSVPPSVCLSTLIVDYYSLTCMFYLVTKGDSLPNLDHLLSPPLSQISMNEPARLAPVPAWRKVNSIMPIETN